VGLRAAVRLKPGPSRFAATLGPHYNQRRTHSALGNRAPLTRVREVTGHNT